ncbi:MAG: hypothetical protein LBC93_02175 [Synergistaceae bacterium]|jgi:hypothetical protein|nr:hypothetical protein [Synergistaceae bacterium]
MSEKVEKLLLKDFSTKDTALESMTGKNQGSTASSESMETEDLSRRTEGFAMRIYYAVEFVYLSKKRYCVWYSFDDCGFAVKDDQVLCFDDVSSLKSYCHEHQITIDDDGGDLDSYNVGTILDWLGGKIPGFDYQILLNFWNITTDIAESVSVDFYGDTDGLVLDVYKKVFYANNLPILKGDGEDFIPTWDEEELLELKKVMQDAVRIVCKFCFQAEIGS